MKYTKTNINNFVLHTIKTNNFKSIKVMINFRRKLKKEEATINAYLFLLLTYRTKKYDYKSLIERKEDLYGAMLYSNIDYESDLYKNNSIHLTFLHPKYTEVTNEIDSLNLLKEVIFNPIFNDSITNKNIKEILKTKIISDKEDKKINSRNIMSSLLNKDFPNKFGYIDELDDIDEIKLNNYYKDTISNDQVDIFVVGDIDVNFYIDFFKNMFKTNNRYTKKVYKEYKKIEEKFFYEEEKDTNQARLLVALKPINFDFNKDRPINRVYGNILGIGPSSKLFRVIREKHSLAYFTSLYKEDLQISVLDSGIDIKNYDKALSLIKECLKDMDTISLEDLNTAKKTLITSLESIEYYQNNIINFYLSNELLQESKTVLDLIEEINSVSLNNIKEFNKKVNIDTILLYGDKNE